LESKSSSHPKASLTNPNVALLAVQPEERSVLITVAAVAVATEIEFLARCIPPPALSVANRRKSPLSLVAINRYTAGIATPGPDNTANKPGCEGFITVTQTFPAKPDAITWNFSEPPVTHINKPLKEAMLEM
jgi:hypothetical protein